MIQFIVLDWNKTQIFEAFPSDVKLYFPGDDNIVYVDNGNTQLSPASPTKLTLAMGEYFLTPDNRKTFLGMENGQGTYTDHKVRRK